MEAFVARHPIFSRNRKVHGYDLRFRDGFEEFYRTVTSDRANVNFRIAANLEELAGHGSAFVDFPPALLQAGLPSLFSTDALTIVLPADTPTDTPTLSACHHLRNAGYEFALRGFDCEGLAQSPLLEIADLVEVDLDGSDVNPGRVEQTLAPFGAHMLARGVDTPERFTEAADWGFAYFQGGFFRKPVLKPGRQVETGQLTYLQVLNKVNQPELPYDELEALIKQDVAMTYKLLRFINSAWYGLRKRVESIHHALVLLGPREVRVWASMLVLRQAGEGKPHELLRQALTRAKAAEEIAPRIGRGSEASELFLMGMFSLVDALTDIELSRVLEGLPLSERIQSALLGAGGPYRLIYDTILAYEAGQWDLLRCSAEAIDLCEDEIPAVFQKARRWAEQALLVL
jgi:c-di-GMP-related signal transduction protein